MRIILDGSHLADTERNSVLGTISTNFINLYRNKEEETKGGRTNNPVQSCSKESNIPTVDEE